MEAIEGSCAILASRQTLKEINQLDRLGPRAGSLGAGRSPLETMRPDIGETIQLREHSFWFRLSVLSEASSPQVTPHTLRFPLAAFSV